MNALLDSSVLVAALLTGHPRHEEAVRWLIGARDGQIQAFACQHGLAETYAVLTGLPKAARVPPQEASMLIHDLASFVKVVELSPADYLEGISRLAAAKMESGAIYDMLHAIAAEKCQADCLVTGNSKHFQRLPLRIAIDIVESSSQP